MNLQNLKNRVAWLFPTNERAAAGVADGSPKPFLAERPAMLDSLRFLPYLLLVFLAVIIFKSAWLSEDSYIAWRTVDNFAHGEGLRWNLLDRVQTFTNPLFVLLVTGFYQITHEIFITVTLLCMALSLLAVWIPLRGRMSGGAAAAVGLCALFSSRAFIDFSTSGLENPMSFLLVSLFLSIYFSRSLLDRQTVLQLALLAGLIGLNRLDLVLIVFPALLHAFCAYGESVRWKVLPVIWRLALAFAPLWGWLLFSTLYYGFPFPNTYYAKLHTGIPKWDLFVQGIFYLINSLSVDTATLIIVAVATVLAWSFRDRRAQIAVLGSVLYIGYVLKVGGDFMSGRFFSVPVFVAAVILMRLPLPRSMAGGLAVLFIALGLLNRSPAIFYNEDMPAETNLPVVDHRGIADERRFYYVSSGFLPALQRGRYEMTKAPVVKPDRFRNLAATRKSVKISRHIGFTGYYAGPAIHIIDSYALGDPLLSKLPIHGGSWRVGHYGRRIPERYEESLRSGVNHIRDPQIARLYDVIKIITQDKIWSWRRLREIYKINTGAYSSLMQASAATGKDDVDPVLPARPVAARPEPAAAAKAAEALPTVPTVPAPDGDL